MNKRNLIFDGIDFYEEFGLVIGTQDDFTETPPEPKTSWLEVPFGNDIDLTEVVDGTVWFSNRKHTIRFNTVLVNRESELIALFSKVMSRVHGKYGTYSLSWDTGCTYEGRLSVTSTEYTLRHAGYITVEIDASPWKDRGTHYTKMRSRGGFTYTVEAGRMPSVPTFELTYPTTVVVNGVSAELHAGYDSDESLVLREGDNVISLVSTEGLTVRTIAEVADLYATLGDMEGKLIYEVACVRDETSEPDVIMTYEWKDL
jgi:hypothetical protein